MGAKQRVTEALPSALDAEVEAVSECLYRKFPVAEVRRFPYGDIRIRIVDSRFAEKNRVKRERMVTQLIHSLPPEIQSQVLLLLLLAPDEKDDSILSLEFDKPGRKLS